MACFASRNIEAKIIPLTWKIYSYIGTASANSGREIHVILNFYED